MLNPKDPELWRIPDPNDDEDEETPQPQYTRQQRRWAALGALKGALLIGGAYLLGLGIIIGLMFLFW